MKPEQMQQQFAQHLVTDAPSKCWKVAKPGTWNYGYFITWSPGHLSITGDLYTLVIEHYHAMPTWQEAVKWLLGSDFTYIMQKARAPQEINITKSLEAFIKAADEQFADGDDSLWQLVLKHWPYDAIHAVGDTPDLQDENHRSDLAKWLRNELVTEEDLIELSGGDPDGGFAVREYSTQQRWQFEALQFWAKQILPQTQEKVAA